MFNSWLKRGGVLLGVVVACALGAALYRWLAPPKVVTVTKVEERIVVKEVVKEVKVAQQVVKRVIVKVKEPTPDGPKVTTTVTEDIKTDTKDTKDSEVAKTEDTKSDTKETKSSLSRPDWRIGVLGGAAISTSPASLINPVALPTPSWVVGAQVERRILGPISAGLWGFGGPSSGAVGISASVEF